jgi:hypothetical protein
MLDVGVEALRHDGVGGGNTHARIWIGTEGHCVVAVGGGRGIDDRQHESKTPDNADNQAE